MTNEHDLETSVREALQQVSKLTPATPDLAERLIANASSGRTAVVPLRLARRFTIPLLAAAACIVVIVAVVLGGEFAADRSVDPPAVIQPTPTVASPTGGPSSAAASAAHSTSASSTSNGSAQTEGQGASPVRQLPPATGAPDGFRAAAVNFMDSKTGWALGDAQCATGTKTSCPALIRTEDGGASWHRLTIPDGLSSATVGCGAAPCVDRVTFADERIGYLWGRTSMLVTTDGGASWKPISVSRALFDVSVVGDRTVRVHLDDEGTGNSVPSITVDSGPIGSTAFTAMTITAAGRPLAYESVTPAGRTALYAAGFDSSSKDTPPDPQIFRTEDGIRWEPILVGERCPAGSVGALDGSLIFDCIDYLRVVAAGSKSLGPPRPVTVAKGLTQRVELAQSATEIAVVAEGSDDLGRTVSSWYRTVDGGVSWRAPVKFPDAFPIQQSVVTTPGGLFGISTDKAALQFSLDGGTTWQSRTF